MQKKILFTDIDGTLLNDKREIPKENKEAIDKALAAGHSIVIATGRPLDSGKKIVEELGLTMQGCYMIAYNGAIIYDCGNDRVLEKKFVPYPYVEELFKRGKEAGLYVQTYNKTQIITTQDTPELEYYRQHTKLTYQVVDDVMSVLEEEPQKVMLINLTDKKKLEKFQADNLEWEEGKCHSFFSMDTYLEYAPINATKAYGIHYLCELLGVPLENTIAAGDERNDIPMIEEAHIGVAMKNAKDEVKASADYITKKNNNEGGIAEVIEKFML
ncbi:MAG: Cof-type HAD-IIB family hydrolase [Lachnospiraceae bacterium]